MKTKIFISYVHEDEAFKEELEKRLKPYRRTGKVESWNDRAILAGTEWDDEIKHQLEAANIIIFLVSPDFLASDYVHDVQIANALERYNNGLVRIVPIVVRPSDLSELQIKSFQALPKDAKAITQWPDQDVAWLNVIDGLKRIFTLQIPNKQEHTEIKDPSAPKAPIEITMKVKELISEAKLEDVFDYLNKNSNHFNKDFNNLLVLLSAKFKKLKRDKLTGIITSYEEQVRIANLNNELLELIDN